jgi:hypothetical protein
MNQFKSFFTSTKQNNIPLSDGGDLIFTTNQFRTYESNLDPYLKYMHLKKIIPSGWIRIPAKKYQFTTDPKYITSKTTYSVVVD